MDVVNASPVSFTSNITSLYAGFSMAYVWEKDFPALDLLHSVIRRTTHASEVHVIAGLLAIQATGVSHLLNVCSFHISLLVSTSELPCCGKLYMHVRFSPSVCIMFFCPSHSLPRCASCFSFLCVSIFLYAFIVIFYLSLSVVSVCVWSDSDSVVAKKLANRLSAEGIIDSMIEAANRTNVNAKASILNLSLSLSLSLTPTHSPIHSCSSV